MTSPRQLRMLAAFGRTATARGTRRPSRAERLLRGIGADTAFADDVLGDLAEERLRRVERDGVVAARWWHLHEAMRSVPHLAWNAVRHGGPRGRRRVAVLLAAASLVPTAVLLALLLRTGPPARLVVEGQGTGEADDGIVVNTTHPVQLGMRVLDASGRALRAANVRYRWLSGTPLPVSPSGAVTCSRRGDATLRASVGSVQTTVLLRCRPVHEVRADWGLSFLAGDPERDLAFVALDRDGRPVDRLTGELRVDDSTVATLTGSRVRPLAPGRTYITVRIGDGEARTGVTVYEPVRTFEGLRRDQLYVVAPLRLAAGETFRWTLPKGLFWLRYNPGAASGPSPTLVVDGPIMCMPELAPGVHDVRCLARTTGTSLRVMHPGTTARAITGTLALERQEKY